MNDYKSIYILDIKELIYDSGISTENFVELNIDKLDGLSRMRGVYILIFEENMKNPYVGSTIDLKHRLTAHRQKSESIKIESVIFIRTIDMEEAILLEDFLKRNLDCSNKINVIRDKKDYRKKKIYCMVGKDKYEIVDLEKYKKFISEVKIWK